MLNSEKFIIYSDFDGTITTEDVLDKIITELYSYEKYKQLESDLINDKMKYEDYLINTFNDLHYDLSNISLNIIDPFFDVFYDWIIKNNIKFYIISSGFNKIIKKLLPYVDSEFIYANYLDIDEKNKWTVKLFNDTKSINKTNIIDTLNISNHKTIFIGDGLSDFTVLGHIDYLFCKKNSLLHLKCIEDNYNCYVFDDFQHLLHILNDDFCTFKN